MLNATFFALNHWIFTWHFFEAAQMFKLTYSEQTYSTLNQINRRKRILSCLNISGYLFLFLLCSFTMWFAVRDKTYFEFYRTIQDVGAFYMILLAVLSLWAIKEI